MAQCKDPLTSSGTRLTSQESDCGPTSHSNHLPVATVDVHKGKPVRLQVKVVVPTHDHPNYNFVGKLLGPKGNSLKWLQEKTQTKMAILGKGSMRNKEKEEELRRLGDEKYLHLNEELHVEITAFAPAPEAYLRISNALFEVKRFLVPDYYDEIRQQQLRELGVITDDQVDGNFSLLSPSKLGSNPPTTINNEMNSISIPSSSAPDVDLAIAARPVSFLCPVESVNSQMTTQCSMLKPFSLSNNGNIHDLSYYTHKSPNQSKLSQYTRPKPYARPPTMNL